jgi:hypothetical protein
MKNEGVKKIIMIGDSIIVIRHLVYKSLPKDPHLNRLLCHTLLEGFFEEVKFFAS